MIDANHRISRFSTILIESLVKYRRIWALRENELFQNDISLNDNAVGGALASISIHIMAYTPM